MILFTCVCDIASGNPLACADHSGTSSGAARKSAVGSEVLLAASQASQRANRQQPGRQIEASTLGELRLISLICGPLGFFAAVPSTRQSSAFLAVAFLADIAARWDAAPMDDVALLACLVNHSTARVVGDAAFGSADVLAATGTTAGATSSPTRPNSPAAGWGPPSSYGGGVGVVGSGDAAADEAIVAARRSSTQMIAASRQAAAELRASQHANDLALATRCAELEAAKKQMEEHSEALLGELRAVREEQLAQLRGQAASAAEAAEKRRIDHEAAAVERSKAAEAWSARVVELQASLTESG